MDVVMRASDTVVVLHHGEKIAEGTPQAIGSDRAVIAAYLGQDWMADAVG
jgi:branched-chain amino acid transport system ATP-binding protein